MENLKDKIICSEQDLVGVFFLGTKEKDAQSSFENVNKFIEMGPPTATGIRALQVLVVINTVVVSAFALQIALPKYVSKLHTSRFYCASIWHIKIYLTLTTPRLSLKARLTLKRSMAHWKINAHCPCFMASGHALWSLPAKSIALIKLCIPRTHK